MIPHLANTLLQIGFGRHYNPAGTHRLKLDI